jgi:hypothetical protein
VRTLLVLVAWAAVNVTAGAAQTQHVEVDPVQCWWRTSVPAVRVGETFTIHLTCSALETDAVRAVIDRSRLGTAAVQFPPFEVTGGTQSEDYATAGRRFMQYHYRLRLIAEEFFGSDIVIPAMTITYRIESRVQADAAVQGREQSYELPALTLRINSLVPNDATHIRESAVPTFDEIAAREFRARLFRLVAMILFGLAALMLVITVLRWVREKRHARLTTAKHFVPARAVLAAVRRELRDVERAARGAGWSVETVARALAATRVAAGYLAGHPVAQIEVDSAQGGQVSFGRGLFGRRRIAVSAATTSQEVRDRADVPDLEDALSTFTAARYGREDTYDGAALDHALAVALRATSRAAAQHTWAAGLVRSIQQALRAWTPRAWAR